MSMESKIQTSAMDVAKYIITKFCGEDNEIDTEVSEGVSNLKLQKLLYFCQAFSLVRLGKPMFKESICAWKYGPVVSEVYENYKEYTNEPLPGPEESSSILSDEDMEVVNEVLEMFGGYSAIRLMEITHSHKPWKNLKRRVEKGERDVTIEQKAIEKYYKPILSEESEEYVGD